MPTRSTGLDYYDARYYDPVAGQFTSADTALAGGFNRYAYVGGNPGRAPTQSGITTLRPVMIHSIIFLKYLM